MLGNKRGMKCADLKVRHKDEIDIKVKVIYRIEAKSMLIYKSQ